MVSGSGGQPGALYGQQPWETAWSFVWSAAPGDSLELCMVGGSGGRRGVLYLFGPQEDGMEAFLCGRLHIQG